MHGPCGKMLFFSLLVLALGWGMPLAAQEAGSLGPRRLVETSPWMLANLGPDSPEFYQVCLGYQLDWRSTLFLNGITWKYRAPLGIPMWDPAFDSPAQDYPGYIRAFGLGLGYQAILWKGLFASVYAIPFLQDFHAQDGSLIQSGFQLYLQAQLGYQIDLFKGRMFIKPSVYVNYWPVNTNFPVAFLDKEGSWPNYQPFEPHLNIGFRF